MFTVTENMFSNDYSIEGVIFPCRYYFMMFLRAIKGLNDFRNQSKLSRGDRAKARDYIRELFSVGFNPEEIMFFAARAH